VAPIAVPTTDSALRLQIHLDSEAAAEAARWKDARPHLEEILASVGPEHDHTWDDEPECNSHFDFHQHVAAHARHELLAKAVNDCMIETERVRRHLLRQGADVAHDVELHRGIVEALEQSPAKARKAARDHAEAHRAQLLAALGT
jgi:DNA-binding FadR family transcriptional regulator